MTRPYVRCTHEPEPGQPCAACNRRRVYNWRAANLERWRQIQNKSRRKARRTLRKARRAS